MPETIEWGKPSIAAAGVASCRSEDEHALTSMNPFRMPLALSGENGGAVIARSWKHCKECLMPHDPKLVEDARRRDLVAVAQLLAVCQPNLRRIARSQCASGVDPDDAVQKSMLLPTEAVGVG